MTDDDPPDGEIRIAYTLLESADGSLLTKMIWVNEVGEEEKRAAAWPASGVFLHIEHVGTADEILEAVADRLCGLTPQQAIIVSLLAPDGRRWRLRRMRDAESEWTLPRSQETFHAVIGPALGFFDVDVPDRLRGDIRSAQELYEKVLKPAWSGFGDVAMLIRPSVGSGGKRSGEAAPFPGGYHCFFVISDGRQLGRLAEALFDRLGLLGRAVVEPSRRGSILRKALVDISASKGAERLIFEADPKLGRGMERVLRECVRFSGGILDAAAAIEAISLSESERRTSKLTWDLAEDKAKEACREAKAAWLQTRALEIGEERGIAPEAAYEAAKAESEAFEVCELWDDVRVRLDDGTNPTVYEILSDPEKYHLRRGFSLDEPRPRRGVTQIYAKPRKPAKDRPAGPYLHTFERGGKYLRLRSRRLEGQNGKAAETGKKPGEATELAIGALLREAEELHAGRMVRFDTFSNQVLMCRSLPRPGVAADREFVPHLWSDVDSTHLIEWLQAKGYGKVVRNRVEAAIEAEAHRNAFSSAAKHLLSLPAWDGIERLDNFWLDICGAEADPDSEGRSDENQLLYLSETARRFFIGIVARVFDPGCKLDTMLILEGEQGAKKSTLLRVIAFDRDDWFSDSLPIDLSSKDARDHLSGRLVIEMAEIGHLKRSNVEALKTFLSAQDDKYRPAYRQRPVTPKRQCVCVGTTNEVGYLKDETGNRRFWLVHCGAIDIEAARRVIVQVYAEALHYYRQGERWWLEGPAAVIAETEQRGRLVSDAWDDRVEKHVHERQAAALQKGETEIVLNVSDILEKVLEVPLHLMNKSHETRLGLILARLGSRRDRRSLDGRPRSWCRVMAVAR